MHVGIAQFEVTIACAVQESMLIRIQTARDEMNAIREFDYGEPLKEHCLKRAISAHAASNLSHMSCAQSW